MSMHASMHFEWVKLNENVYCMYIHFIYITHHTHTYKNIYFTHSTFPIASNDVKITEIWDNELDLRAISALPLIIIISIFPENGIGVLVIGLLAEHRVILSNLWHTYLHRVTSNAQFNIELGIFGLTRILHFWSYAKYRFWLHDSPSYWLTSCTYNIQKIWLAIPNKVMKKKMLFNDDQWQEKKRQRKSILAHFYSGDAKQRERSMAGETDDDRKKKTKSLVITDDLHQGYIPQQ